MSERSALAVQAPRTAYGRYALHAWAAVPVKDKGGCATPAAAEGARLGGHGGAAGEMLGSPLAASVGCAGAA